MLKDSDKSFRSFLSERTSVRPPPVVSSVCRSSKLTIERRKKCELHIIKKSHVSQIKFILNKILESYQITKRDAPQPIAQPCHATEYRLSQEANFSAILSILLDRFALAKK
jgi:hypothetical protein